MEETSNDNYQPRLSWYVIYSDGSAFYQHDHKGSYSSEAIDRARLREFILINQDGKVIIKQHLKPGQKLIYRVRNALKVGHGQLDKIHILGWQQGDSRHVTFIHESTLLINMGDFVDDDPARPWYYPYESLPHDDIAVQ
jgi:hypothetical protein